MLEKRVSFERDDSTLLFDTNASTQTVQRTVRRNFDIVLAYFARRSKIDTSLCKTLNARIVARQCHTPF